MFKNFRFQLLMSDCSRRYYHALIENSKKKYCYCLVFIIICWGLCKLDLFLQKYTGSNGTKFGLNVK